MKSRISIAILLTLLMMCACAPGGHRGNGDDNYFSAYHTFDRMEWPYQSTLTFTADTLRDSVAAGRIAVTLRHTSDYPFSNIWLELSVRPDSLADTPDYVDTLEITLADPFGRWYGSGMGTSFLISDTLPAIRTIHKGASISLRHIMRLDTLSEIEQAGVAFLPTDSR